jgi:LacI family transcriptional regulator
VTTIHDVARAAEVSTATVSRVLNGTGSVSPDLDARVRAAVARLGYRRNAAARTLRRQVSAVWSVVVPDIENPFFTSAVRGIAEVAEGNGFSTVLCNTDEDTGREASFVQIAVDERVAGVIVSPASEEATDLGPLVAAGIPVVLIDRKVRRFDVDAVTVDNKLGAALAAGWLASQGVRAPACVTGPRSASTARDRLAGFRHALRGAGLPLPPSMVRHADFRGEGGKRAVESLLAGDRRPDGLFVANNLMTMGALEALDAAGVRLPDDLHLVGFDEVPWASLLRRQLTVVAQPGRELGTHAARLLLDRIGGVTTGVRHMVLRPELHPAQGG